MEHLTISLLKTFGLPLLVVIFFLEGALIGKLLPTDLALPAAVILFATQIQHYVFLLLLCALSSTAGQISLFKFTRANGEGFITENKRFRVSESRLERSKKWFDRHGPESVLLTNLIPGVRGFLTIPAALSDVHITRFGLYSFTGTTMYQSVLLLIAIGVVSVPKII